MHIIVMAIGSDGDVNPMLEIAGELKSRGHSIDFFANGYFEEKVRERGFGFVALWNSDNRLAWWLWPTVMDLRTGDGPGAWLDRFVEE